MSQVAHWRDEFIAKSEGITDAWEVTKTYAGRLAEWVLFICMIVNIVEILPGVALWTWASNAVLGIQAVTLDIAGFGLASMADHARANGDEKAAKRAQWTGYLLIAIMVITVSLVTCGSLWPDTRWFTAPAEKVLILVRVVMTVVYGHVVHGLRRETQLVQQVNQQQEIEQRIEQIMNHFNTRIQGIQSEVVQVVESIVQSHLNEQSAQVQPLITDSERAMMQQVPSLVNSLVQPLIAATEASISEQLSAQIAVTVQQFKHELRTTVAEVQTSSSGKPALRSITPLAQTEPANEPANIRVPRFIQEQLNQGRKPTLSEIVDACQCAKNTAIRYRRELLGTDEEGVA